MSMLSIAWTVDSVTMDDVRVQLRGVAVVVVPSPPRFRLTKRQDPVDERVRDIVTEQLHATVRTMKASDIIVHRKQLIDEVFAGSRPEVAKVGARLSEINPQAVDFDEKSEFYRQLKLAQARVTQQNLANRRNPS